MILRDIYEAKHGPEAKYIKEHLEPIAMILSRISGKRVTWMNLHHILAGYKGFVLTEELERACQIYANELDGQSEFQARLHQKLFWTTNGIHPDTIISGVSLICAYPPCSARFLRTHPMMRYCPMHRRRRSRKTYYKEQRMK